MADLNNLENDMEFEFSSEEESESDVDSGYSDSDDGNPDDFFQLIIEKSPEQAYELLKCRICGDFCHPPLRSCEVKHLICAYCFAEDQGACRYCGAPRSLTRPLDLEKLHNLLEFNCIHQQLGCSFRCVGRDIFHHISRCPFTMTVCPNLECTWAGKPRDLFNHYEKEHPHNFFGNYIAEVEFDAKKYFTNVFVTELPKNEYIYFNLRLIPLENKIRINARNLGYVEMIEKHKLELRIKKKCGRIFNLDVRLSNYPNYLKHDSEGIVDIEINCDRSEILSFEVVSDPIVLLHMEVLVKKIN